MGNELISIPLCQLRRSRSNIRKTDRMADIEQMAASITANGLLENLVVRPSQDSFGDNRRFYEVEAGGRRLAALKLLAKRKSLNQDHPVSCLVLEGADTNDAIEISLAENIVRAPVHPADQFEAFAKLQKGGMPAEDIAARFGLSSAVVQQRLKLAAVSKRLMAEYRSGAMTLEQLMAFTITDDHARQEEAWFDNPYHDASPAAFKRLLTKSLVQGADRRARFVGAKPYEEAGGIIIRDLFDAEDEGYFSDSALLDRLTAGRLQGAAEKIRAEGWDWVSVQLEPDFDELARYGRARTTEIQLSKKEEVRLAKLAERYDELVGEIEDEGGEESTAELEKVSAELEALQAKKKVWLAEDMAGAGAILSLDHDGNLRIDRGLVRPDEHGKEKAAVTPIKPVKDTAGYAESLFTELSAHRTAALREAVAARPDIAQLALLHVLAAKLLYQRQTPSCLEISAKATDLSSSSDSVGESRAAVAFLARHQSWLERLPQIEQLWDWLLTLAEPEKLELLAHCVSLTVDAVYKKQGGQYRPGPADVLVRATGLDMVEWWRPGESFFNRLTKQQIVQAVTEGVSPLEGRRLDDLKKDRMASKAAKLLAETRWLPEALRAPKEPDAATPQDPQTSTAEAAE